MRALHALRVLARRALDVRRAPREAAPEPDAFRGEARALVAAAPRGLLRGHALVELPAGVPPWLDTGLDLEAGEEVTWIASGRVVLSGPLDLWVGPRFQLWARVGEAGPIFDGTRDTHSFVAPPGGGRLYLAGLFPGRWADRSGRLATSLDAYRGARGGLSVLLLRWRGDADRGLRTLAEAGPLGDALRDELARRTAPGAPPQGWSYLWFLGHAEIFRRGARGILCETHRDVGILQREAPAPLRPGTKLRWSWRVDALPSRLPEDVAFTHDYVSIAVEFENGRDLSYTWSAALPAETGYRCPLDGWQDREFHVVVRSGTHGLGGWCVEERDLHADYARFVGPPPQRILRVWLIANSVFQGREGRAEFAGIEILPPGATPGAGVVVLPEPDAAG